MKFISQDSNLFFIILDLRAQYLFSNWQMESKSPPVRAMVPGFSRYPWGPWADRNNYCIEFIIILYKNYQKDLPDKDRSCRKIRMTKKMLTPERGKKR